MKKIIGKQVQELKERSEKEGKAFIEIHAPILSRLDFPPLKPVIKNEETAYEKARDSVEFKMKTPNAIVVIYGLRRVSDDYQLRITELSESSPETTEVYEVEN